MVDYQNVIDYITQLMYVLSPIAIAFVIISIITNYFLSFIRGDRRVKL